MRVFITGATGFVGGHVARSYAAEGARLRLLTRQTSRLDSLEGIDAEMVTGDLREPEKLRTALTGCDALVHVAADYRLWVRDPKEMYASQCGWNAGAAEASARGWRSARCLHVQCCDDGVQGRTARS